MSGTTQVASLETQESNKQAGKSAVKRGPRKKTTVVATDVEQQVVPSGPGSTTKPNAPTEFVPAVEATVESKSPAKYKGKRAVRNNIRTTPENVASLLNGNSSGEVTPDVKGVTDDVKTVDRFEDDKKINLATVNKMIALLARPSSSLSSTSITVKKNNGNNEIIETNESNENENGPIPTFTQPRTRAIDSLIDSDLGKHFYSLSDCKQVIWYKNVSRSFQKHGNNGKEECHRIPVALYTRAMCHQDALTYSDRHVQHMAIVMNNTYLQPASDNKRHSALEKLLFKCLNDPNEAVTLELRDRIYKMIKLICDGVTDGYSGSLIYIRELGSLKYARTGIVKQWCEENSNVNQEALNKILNELKFSKPLAKREVLSAQNVIDLCKINSDKLNAFKDTIKETNEERKKFAGNKSRSHLSTLYKGATTKLNDEVQRPTDFKLSDLTDPKPTDAKVTLPTVRSIHLMDAKIRHLNDFLNTLESDDKEIYAIDEYRKVLTTMIANAQDTLALLDQ